MLTIPTGCRCEHEWNPSRTRHESSRARREVVTDLYCDINGERWRIDDWGFALLRTQRLFQDGSTYTNAVGEWGDVGAASGELNGILAIQARRSAMPDIVGEVRRMGIMSSVEMWFGGGGPPRLFGLRPVPWFAG